MQNLTSHGKLVNEGIGMLSEFLPGHGYLSFLGCILATLCLVAKLTGEILFSCVIPLDSACLFLVLQHNLLPPQIS